MIEEHGWKTALAMLIFSSIQKLVFHNAGPIKEYGPLQQPNTETARKPIQPILYDRLIAEKLNKEIFTNSWQSNFNESLRSRPAGPNLDDF